MIAVVAHSYLAAAKSNSCARNGVSDGPFDRPNNADQQRDTRRSNHCHMLKRAHEGSLP